MAVVSDPHRPIIADPRSAGSSAARRSMAPSRRRGGTFAVEIIDLLRALRRFWALALGVLILFLSLGAAAAFLPAKQYTATTILIANPTDDELDITDFDAVRALLPSLIETVDTETFEDAVKDDLDRPVRGDLDIEATIQPGTLVVHMSATHTVPAVAQAMA